MSENYTLKNIRELTGHFYYVQSLSSALLQSPSLFSIGSFPRDFRRFFIRILILHSRWSVKWSPESQSASTHSSCHFTAALITTRFLSSNPTLTDHAHISIPGHERALTQIKFNKEGDLLFSCSKDHVVNAWFSHNGERLGTYDGHNGAVWTIDVDCMSLSLFALSRMNIINPTDQPNQGSSSPVLPITPSDCGPFSQANVSTSGNFPQPSNAWLSTIPMTKSFA